MHVNRVRSGLGNGIEVSGSLVDTGITEQSYGGSAVIGTVASEEQSEKLSNALKVVGSMTCSFWQWIMYPEYCGILEASVTATKVAAPVVAPVVDTAKKAATKTLDDFFAEFGTMLLLGGGALVALLVLPPLLSRR
jgi:hypothetical protein